MTLSVHPMIGLTLSAAWQASDGLVELVLGVVG
jgi:hypothetical protein